MDCWGRLWASGGNAVRAGPSCHFAAARPPAVGRCRLPQARARHGGGAGAAAVAVPAAAAAAAAVPGGGRVAAAAGPELPARRRPLPGAGPPVPLRRGGRLGRGAGLRRAGRRLPAVLAAALRPSHR